MHLTGCTCCDVTIRTNLNLHNVLISPLKFKVLYDQLLGQDKKMKIYLNKAEPTQWPNVLHKSLATCGKKFWETIKKKIFKIATMAAIFKKFWDHHLSKSNTL